MSFIKYLLLALVVTTFAYSTPVHAETLDLDLQRLGYQSVEQFQEAYQLPVTGYGDSATRSEITHAIVKSQLVTHARRYIGTQYVWGASNPKVGFDCSGFVYYVFKQEGIPLPRARAVQLSRSGKKIARANLQPGDLVFFSKEHPGLVSHVGIYVGRNRFISATNRKGVWIYPLSNRYWNRHYLGARRVY